MPTQSIQSKSAESGFALATFTVFLIAFLLMASLAINSGVAYYRKQALQEALDLATLKAASFLLDETLSEAEVKRRLGQIVLANLRRSGTSPAGIAHTQSFLLNPFSITISEQRSKISATLETIAPYPFLSSMQEIPSGTIVSASASAIASRLALSFVIDRSGSMALCMDPQNCTNGFPSRLDAAKAAINYIVPMLKTGDQISITSYDNQVRVDLPLTPPLNSQNAQQLGVRFTRAVNNLSPGATTHHWKGIRAAANDFENSTTPGRPNRIEKMLLLTDGAPCCQGEVTVDPCLRSLWGNTAAKWMSLYKETLDAAIDVQQSNKTKLSIDVIGIGQIDSQAQGHRLPNYRNPYQNYTRTTLVKQILLSYVANDQSKMINPPILPTPPPPINQRPYYWDFHCENRTGATRTTDPVGRYAFATNGPELAQLFSKFVRENRVRLVNS